MIEIFEKASQDSSGEVDDSIALDHVQREKGRLKVISQKGEEVRLFLERGQVLKKGEILRSRCQRNIKVELAGEPLVVATTSSWEDFSRACFHLGNRHTRIQIGQRSLSFLDDSVLEELVQRLGLTTTRQHLPFEPESGAYGHSHAGKEKHHGHHH